MEIEQILAKVRAEQYLTKAEAQRLAKEYAGERERARIFEAELLRMPDAAPFPRHPMGDYSIVGERDGEHGRELLYRCNNCGDEEWGPTFWLMAG